MDDDDTKADAPLTPDEERALREAWAHIGSWEPWDGQEPGATYESAVGAALAQTYRGVQ